MYSESIQTCPKEVWDSNQIFSFQAYHTLFFLDYYQSTNPVGFAPPSEFSYSEFDEDPQIVIFSQESLLHYLDACKEKARNLIESLDEQGATQRWINESKTMDYSLFEILLTSLQPPSRATSCRSIQPPPPATHRPCTRMDRKRKLVNNWLKKEFFKVPRTKYKVRGTKYEIENIECRTPNFE